jgi:hypothetical protein
MAAPASIELNRDRSSSTAVTRLCDDCGRLSIRKPSKQYPSRKCAPTHIKNPLVLETLELSPIVCLTEPDELTVDARRPPKEGTAMQNLMCQQGDSGDDVKTLQQALTGLGFSPGEIDGIYGQGTVAAVIAFQNNKGLLHGRVARPRSLSALGVADSDVLPSAIPAVSVEIISQMFPVTPIGNIKTNMPPVVSALVKNQVSDKPMVLMAQDAYQRGAALVPISLGT